MRAGANHVAGIADRNAGGLILIVAPSPIECVLTARAFGLDFCQVGRMRFVSRAHHLRGWSRGTPFLARERSRWNGEGALALDKALDLLTRRGQLRPANDRDLTDFLLKEGCGVKVSKVLCPECSGSGVSAMAATYVAGCFACGGKGRVSPRAALAIAEAIEDDARLSAPGVSAGWRAGKIARAKRIRDFVAGCLALEDMAC